MLRTLRSQTDKANVSLEGVFLLDVPANKSTKDARWSLEEAAELSVRTMRPNDRPTATARAFLDIIYIPGAITDGPERTASAHGRFIHILPDEIDRRLAEIRERNPEFMVTLPEVERCTLLHEIGHALGLVDLGAPMIHERLHPESDYHSRSTRSIMRPGTSDPGPRSEAIFCGFDEYDLEDLAAFRLQGRQYLAERGIR